MNDMTFNARTALRSGSLKGFKTEVAAARFGQFIRACNGEPDALEWCREHQITVAKAAGGTVGTTGGFLVPTEFMQRIIDLREEFGSFRSAADVVPMASGMADIPRRDGGLTAYFVDESASITESQGTWGNVALNAKKLATLSRTSHELFEGSAVDIGDRFAVEIAYAFAVKEDSVGWNGTGISTDGNITGVCPRLLSGDHEASKVVAASGHDTFAEIDAADLVALISKLPAYAVPGARWFISHLGFALTFSRLASAAGGFVSQVINGRNVLSFMGFPVQLTQALPQIATDLSGSVMMCFGDLSLAATLGERRGITIAKSDQRLLEFDQILWRGTERVDISVHSLGDGTTAGPLIGLVGE